MLYNKKINEGGNFIISDTCLLDIEIWSEIKYKKVDKKMSKAAGDANKKMEDDIKIKKAKKSKSIIERHH